MFAEITSLDEKHDNCIEFLMAIHDSNEIPRILLCKDLNHGVGVNSEVRHNGGVLTAKTYLRAGWRRSLSCS